MRLPRVIVNPQKSHIRTFLFPRTICELLDLTVGVVFWPQSIPYQSLGPLGLFTQDLDCHHTLLHNGCWFAWLIDMGESL
uniref:Transmembrane protein 254 n=2 Tax=Canis lupus familiaris TaxID=9615 RepID=A0A8C0RZN0_CANLF